MIKSVSFLLLSDSDMPTFFELIDELFALNLDSYDNLGISEITLSGLRGVIIALFLGAVIGAVMSLFNKRVLGEFVRALISENCTTPESAKTLAELGFLKNSAVRSSLRSGGLLGKTVRCVEEDRFAAETVKKRGLYELRTAESGEKRPPFREIEYKRELDTAHFYIPASKSDSAEMRFSKKGTNWGTLVLGIIASLILLWLVMRILPDLLQLLDNFAGKIDS